jgi:hypothetical protein
MKQEISIVYPILRKEGKRVTTYNRAMLSIRVQHTLKVTRMDNAIMFLKHTSQILSSTKGGRFSLK